MQRTLTLRARIEHILWFVVFVIGETPSIVLRIALGVHLAGLVLGLILGLLPLIVGMLALAGALPGGRVDARRPRPDELENLAAALEQARDHGLVVPQGPFHQLRFAVCPDAHPGDAQDDASALLRHATEPMGGLVIGRTVLVTRNELHSLGPDNLAAIVAQRAAHALCWDGRFALALACLRFPGVGLVARMLGAATRGQWQTAQHPLTRRVAPELRILACTGAALAALAWLAVLALGGGLGVSMLSRLFRWHWRRATYRADRLAADVAGQATPLAHHLDHVVAPHDVALPVPPVRRCVPSADARMQALLADNVAATRAAMPARESTPALEEVDDIIFPWEHDDGESVEETGE